MVGYTYILLCSDGTLYTGSTIDLGKRLTQHKNGEGANHTKKRLPIELIYFETHKTVYKAFYREKQIQKWTRRKKWALINGDSNLLHQLSKCENETSHEFFEK